MTRQLKRKRVQFSSDDEDVSSSHQVQPSSLSVDSLMRSILLEPSTSQPSSSASLLASHKQANLETNKGLKEKSRAQKLKGG